MTNLPPNIMKQIQDKICRPEGTLEFKFSSDSLFEPKDPGGIILDIIAGAHYFKIEKNFMRLLFYHSSPGTGTRVATIDLRGVKQAPKVRIVFTWTPKEIKTYIGPYVKGGELVKAVGTPSPANIRITKNGDVVQIGDAGVEIGHYSLFAGGKPMLQPTAIETWENSLKAIEILQKGSSEDGFIFETVVSNLSIATIVTGFEVYCKRRFVELEQEGIKPDIEPLVASFFTKEERDTHLPESIKNNVANQNETFLEIIAEKRIDFQNYSRNKKAYNKAYNIKFGEIGLTSNELAFLQKIIQYRHRIIHISPLIGMLNQPAVPPEEPIFSNKELVKRAMECLNKFIRNLHQATLNLRRQD